jgi:hypothetical protein
LCPEQRIWDYRLGMGMVGDTRVVGSRSLLAKVVGPAVAALGVASLVVLAIQPTLDVQLGVEDSIYGWYHWGLALAVIAAGAGIVGGRRPVRVASSVVGAVAAAQLAGVGLVARGKWFAYFGPIGGPVQNHEKLEKLALSMTACGVVAALACLAQLAADQSFSRRATPLALRMLLPMAGIALAVVTLILLTRYDNGTDMKTVGAVMAVYGLPWGVSIAVSAWLRPPAATAAALAVVGSASLAAFCDTTWPRDFNGLLILDQGDAAGFGAAAAAATVVMLVHLVVDRERPATRAS